MSVSRFSRGIVLKVFYPVLMLIAAFRKGRKEAFQYAIIRMNNRLVRAEGKKTKRIMLLLPHCLQINDCSIRLTHNIFNCKRCGRCEIKDLIEIAEQNQLNLFVATGGTLARKIVKEIAPEAIVAVACERDLSSGLVDTFPLPVLGIPNERPFGPCFNTRVDLAQVKEAIAFFGAD
ncbi:MAG TPA: DUF116 domain-containing protein [Thermodesulfovibrionales bacterium]|nr:DUF116 domain-containing protein [Thermodesulfovibrionales bacterium]